VQKDNESGDTCHYNIVGMSKNVARKFFKKNAQSLDTFKVCNKNNESSELDLLDLK
jgi:hypothetical protein